MKLKILVGTIRRDGTYDTSVERIFDITSASNASIMRHFMDFFVSNPELPTTPEVDDIIRATDPSVGNLTVSDLLAIRYFMERQNKFFTYYIIKSDFPDDTGVLSDSTLSSGVLALNDNEKLLGFIPTGLFLNFQTEDSADPVNLYDWISKNFNLFPSSVVHDPFETLLSTMRLQKQMVGTSYGPVYQQGVNILQSFGIRLIIV